MSHQNTQQNAQLLEPKIEPGLQSQPITNTIYSQPSQPQIQSQPELQPIQIQPQTQMQTQILTINQQQQPPIMQQHIPNMQFSQPNVMQQPSIQSQSNPIQTQSIPIQTQSSTTATTTTTIPLAPSPKIHQQDETQQPLAPPPPPSTTVAAPTMNQRLQDLVNEVDPDEQLDEDVEEVLLDIADEFIENVVSSACAIAKHRNSSSLEVDDVKLYLERKYKIWIPGFGESKPIQKRFSSEAHKQRMALINKQDNRPGEDTSKSKKN